jgi:hypothetical protein
MRTVLSAMIGILILFLFTLAPAVAQEGPDEQEPNDTMQQADSIDGFTIDGEVGRRTDQEDWYKLEGQEGTNPTITLTYDADECDIDLDVYSDDELVGSLTGTEDEDSDEFDVPGTCYLHVYAYDGHGEYTIDIEAGDNGGNGHGEECQGPDEVESNDTQDLADTIDGMQIEGYACEDDDDWFMLNGQEGRHPEFTLTYDTDECDIDMDVYSDDELVGSLTGTDSPDSDRFRVPGTCYLRVYAYDGEGDYTIEITEGGK